MKSINDRLNHFLAPYAVQHGEYANRQIKETDDPHRSPFQRDRDRIIHSRAFRRLRGKRQVLSPTGGDHYRNRLIHSIEVAQVARDIARNLQLNEDLVETIALAHDLGHPPFCHPGEKALNQCMQKFGLKFDHNAHTHRILSQLEEKYPGTNGLNLTDGVLDGVRKHDSDFMINGQRAFSPHLECQLVDISDEIAYVSADIEDGIRGGFFDINQILEFDFLRPAWGNLLPSNHLEVARAVMHFLISRLIVDSQDNLNKKNIQSLEQVQQCRETLILFSPDFYSQFLSLKSHLFDIFYKLPAVQDETILGQKIITSVFDYLVQNPSEVPPKFQTDPIYVGISDFIAGMTDEFLVNFHASKNLEI